MIMFRGEGPEDEVLSTALRKLVTFFQLHYESL